MYQNNDLEDRIQELGPLALDVSLGLERCYRLQEERGPGKLYLSSDEPESHHIHMKSVNKYPVVEPEIHKPIFRKYREFKEVLEDVEKSMNGSYDGLSEKARRTYDSAQGLKKEFIELFTASNQRLVASIARKYKTMLPINDLMQEGNLGLLKAIDRYDPEKKDVNFSTYATWWVRQAVTRAVQDKMNPIRMPVHFQGQIADYVKAKGHLRSMLHRQPTMEEVADFLDTTVEDLEARLGRNHKVISLDTPINEEEDSYLVDIIEDRRSDFVDRIIVQKDADDLKGIISEVLVGRERDIIFLRAEGNTLEEVGLLYNITRERVRQIEAKACRKIRIHMNYKHMKQKFSSYVENSKVFPGSPSEDA